MRREGQRDAKSIIDEAKRVTIEEAQIKYSHLGNFNNKENFCYFDCPFCGKKTKPKELRSGGYAKPYATSLGCNACIGGNVLNSVLSFKFGSENVSSLELLKTAKEIIGMREEDFSPLPSCQNIRKKKTTPAPLKMNRFDRDALLDKDLNALNLKLLCDADEAYLKKVCQKRGWKENLVRSFNDIFVLSSTNKFFFLAYDEDACLHGYQHFDLSVKGGLKMNAKNSDFSEVVFWMPPFLHEGRKDALFVVESPHDAFYLNILGFPSIALFGTALGVKKQEFIRSIFMKYQFEKLIILPDNDQAGIKVKNAFSGTIFNDLQVIYYNFGEITRGECNDIGEGFEKDHEGTLKVLEFMASRD